MQAEPNRPRLLHYVVLGRVVHEQWSKGWSSPLHVVNGRDFAYFQTQPGSNCDVDVFVPVVS